jgi:thiamine biosynthesis lipoprotein
MNNNNNKALNRRQFLKITAIAGSAIFAGKLVNDLIAGGPFFTIKETRTLMGTIINISVVAESSAAGEQAVATTFAEMERQIAIFNHRNPKCPVAQLNKNGKLDQPPIELVDVLNQAVAISNLTGRAFDVTVKPMVDLFNQAQPDLPEEFEVQALLPLVNYQDVNISHEEISFTQHGMSITLDGIAKGYIVDTGVKVLRRLGFGNVFVEAGGDLMASGVKDGENPWRVGVQSPRKNKEGLLASFNVNNQAVATSGDYMLFFTTDMKNHHILDPRSGYSAPHLASATVIASSCAQADALATALMVMKPEDGLSMVDNIANIDALLIGKQLEEYRSSSFKDR